MTESHAEFYERWSAAARPYFAWQFAQLAPYIGRRVVDVGCALGSFVPLFLDHGIDAYRGVENDPELRRRFSARHQDPRIELTRNFDATAPALVDEMREFRADTAFSVNVLEHIERDAAALSHMIGGVSRGGHICLLVPAHPALYGTLDALDGHHRRYTRESLRALVENAGRDQVEWRALYYFNAVGALGWLIKGRVLREKAQADGNYAAMNAILPLVSRVERFIKPPFGLSLVAVLRRR